MQRRVHLAAVGRQPRLLNRTAKGGCRRLAIWFQAMSRGQSAQLDLAALDTFPEVVDGAQVGRVLADSVL